MQARGIVRGKSGDNKQFVIFYEGKMFAPIGGWHAFAAPPWPANFDESSQGRESMAPNGSRRGYTTPFTTFSSFSPRSAFRTRCADVSRAVFIARVLTEAR